MPRAMAGPSGPKVSEPLARTHCRSARCPVRSLLDHLLPEVVAGRLEIPVEAMISDGAVPLADGADAYRRFAARAGGVRKIVFVP